MATARKTTGKKLETAPKLTATAKKTVEKTAEPVAAPVAKAAQPRLEVSTPTLSTLSGNQRWKMVAEAAYYMAQQRGFGPGQQDNDWFKAEQMINSILSESHSAN